LRAWSRGAIVGVLRTGWTRPAHSACAEEGVSGFVSACASVAARIGVARVVRSEGELEEKKGKKEPAHKREKNAQATTKVR